jgi:hypothetical protein
MLQLNSVYENISITLIEKPGAQFVRIRRVCRTKAFVRKRTRSGSGERAIPVRNANVAVRTLPAGTTETLAGL